MDFVMGDHIEEPDTRYFAGQPGIEREFDGTDGILDCEMVFYNDGHCLITDRRFCFGRIMFDAGEVSKVKVKENLSKSREYFNRIGLWGFGLFFILSGIGLNKSKEYWHLGVIMAIIGALSVLGACWLVHQNGSRWVSLILSCPDGDHVAFAAKGQDLASPIADAIRRALACRQTGRSVSAGS